MTEIIEFRQTFESFYAQHYPKVLQYVTSKINDPDDAEDLTEEIFLYCFSHYDQYDSKKSAITTWLYLIVNSRLKNHYRDKKYTTDLEDVIGLISDDRVDLDQACYLEQLKACVQSALETLPLKQRQIIIMHYFQDMNSKEIAQKLEMSPVNVRVQQSRALKHLRNHCKHFTKGE